MLALLVSALPAFAGSDLAASQAQEAPQSGVITGKVFQDFNGNGAFDATPLKDLMVPGVTVTAYDSTGAAVGTTTTVYCTGAGVPISVCTGDNAGQNYSLAASGTGPYRVEFTGLPTGFQPSAHSTDSVNGGTATDAGSSVQFVANGNTSNVNVAINQPTQYVGNSNPYVFTPLWWNGNGSGNDQDTIVRFRYNATAEGDYETVATQTQVGSVWGLAYARQSDTLYASAVLKRHMAMGNAGSNPGGEIYRITGAGSATPGTPSVFATVANVGTIATNSSRGVAVGGATPNGDTAVFSQVGTVGLGDIDISDDDSTLWVVNLSTKALIRIPVATPATQTSYIIPDPSPACVDGQWRPWATKFYGGYVYVGGVCDGSSNSPQPTPQPDLKGVVFRFDPVATTFTQVLTIPLDYTKGYSYGRSCGGVEEYLNQWNVWTSNFANRVECNSAAPYFWDHYPQPVLSDIEFDVDGSMIIGFLDRFSLQTGWANYEPGTTTADEYGIAGGDILRAGNQNGTFVLENNGSVTSTWFGTRTSGAANNQGPGTSEFYKSDTINIPHAEISSGGLALLPGTDQIVYTAYDVELCGSSSNNPTECTDPTYGNGGEWYSQGVNYASNVSGLYQRSFEVIPDQSTPPSIPAAGKNSGIGDVELLLSPAPIEIGNRVWNDANGNGLQDPGESALSNVTVELYKGATKVGQAITDSNGEYYFGGAVCQGGLPGLGSAQTLTIAVAASADDAEQSVNSGTMALTDSLLNMPYEGTFSPVLQLNGTRFQNLTIPQGATITNAAIRFTSGDANSATVNLTIKGQAADNAGAFTTSSNNISSRATTSASVNWSGIPAWSTGESGADTTTPNLASIVQEIVNRVGWTSGNSMVFILSNNGSSSGNQRQAASFDNTTYAAAELVVTYQGAYCVEPNTAYEVRVATNQAALGGFSLAVANAPQPANGNASATTNDPIKDVADSDATLSGNNAVIAFTTGGPGANNHGLDFGFLAARDWGDLPDTPYPTLSATNGPSHAMVSTLYLGTCVDGEIDGQPNPGATGDNQNVGNWLFGTCTPAGNDEEGVAVPVLNAGMTSVVVPVRATNTSPTAAATLRCWFDFDHNGTLTDTGEMQVTTVPANTSNGTFTLTFTGFATPLPTGDTFLRCRIAYNGAEVTNPTGAAASGEVEDYVAPTNPLAVTLASFGAEAQTDHVLVTWETVSEANNSGFNLYRSLTADGERTLLAFTPSAAPGSTQGAAYSYADADVTAGQGYWYWLEDVDLIGAATLHGPVSVVFQAPTAVTLGGLSASGAAGSASLWLAAAGALAALAAAAFALHSRRTAV